MCQSLVAFLLTLLLLHVVSCTRQPDSAHAAGGGDELTPANVARLFIEAKNQNDQETLATFLTRAARKQLESDSGLRLTGGSLEKVELGAAEITGTTARVPVQCEQDGRERDLRLVLRREKAGWKVRGFEVQLASDNSMTVDLERTGDMAESVARGMGAALGEHLRKAFEEASRGGSAEEIARKKARFDALQPLGENEFRASWINGREFRGVVAREALAELAGSLGLGVQAGPHGPRLDSPVRVSVKDLSRLEAIERILAERGLHPVFPSPRSRTGELGGAMQEAVDRITSQLVHGRTSGRVSQGGQPVSVPAAGSGGEIRLEEGPHDWPVTHTGPFQVTVTGLEENVPHATGSVQVVVRSYGLDEGVLSLFDDLPETVSFGAILDTKGRDLRARENLRHLGGGLLSGSSYENTTNLELRNLIREVDVIDRLEGSHPVVIPTAVHTVELSPVAAGIEKRVGEIRLEVRDHGQHTSVDLSGPADTIRGILVRFWALDANGEDLGILYESVNQWRPDSARANLQTPEPPAAVRIKIVTGRVAMDFPFELRGIPLEHHAGQPGRLTPLAFDGHSGPVEVDFLGFAERDAHMPQARLRVRSHANKDSLRLQVRFVYLDARGKALKEFPHTITGRFTVRGHEPVVTAGASGEVESTAFFVPDEANSLRVEVDGVEFVDGTEWKSAQ